LRGHCRMREVRTNRPNLRRLLATSSVAALLIGGGAPHAYAVQCQVGGIAIVGASQGGVNNAAPISCIFISNSTISGSVTNSSHGAITTTHGPPSGTGITISNSTITGTVSNAGSISATSDGILITNNATIDGGIANSGTITSASRSGIVVGGKITGTTISIGSFGGGISASEVGADRTGFRTALERLGRGLWRRR
jgi:hypothetical protein